LGQVAVSTLITLAIVLAAVLPLAYTALAATKRAGEQKARADALDVNLAGMVAQRSDALNQARIEKERADGLDDLIAEMSVRRDVDGAFDELLLKWARSTANRGDGAGIVHPPASPSGPGPDDLLPLE
jgi:hypothetical protein